MTASTEQERKLFEALASDNGKWLKAIERDAKGNYLLLTTANGWMWWQAARRAPAAPVPQGWKLVPEWPTVQMSVAGDDVYREDGPDVFSSNTIYTRMIAAAPHPPEAAQLDDTNVADMHQVFDLKGKE